MKYYLNEVGLNRLVQDRKWMLIEGEYDHVGINTELEEASDISAHYHPKDNLPDLPDLPDLPGLSDIFYFNPRAKNFIINHEGLMCFSGIEKHPKTECLWRPTDFKEFVSIFLSLRKKRMLEAKFDKYQFDEEFLRRMGVNIVRKSWKMLPDNPFSGFKI